MLDRLSTSTAEMSNLIGDLLNLSRATRLNLQLQQLDLSSLVQSILDDLATTEPERGVEQVIDKTCYAHADQGLMQIVMQNLLRNAWKFTGRTAAAKIEFGCTQTAIGVVYFVRDNGAGFDQSLVDRLFQPFQRLHAERDFSGTGIDSPRCSASSSVMVERSGPKARSAKAPPSTSRSRPRSSTHRHGCRRSKNVQRDRQKRGRIKDVAGKFPGER